MSEIEEMIRRTIEKFHAKVESDERLQMTLKGKERSVEIALSDEETYTFTLKDKKIVNFRKGSVPNPDIRVSSNTETLLQLFRKELSPIKAYATGRLKIKASLQDMLTLKSFFDAQK